MISRSDIDFRFPGGILILDFQMWYWH